MVMTNEVAQGVTDSPPDLKLDSQCTCVIDTNVLLELYSIHDVSQLYDRLHAAHGDAAEFLPEVSYRRTRAAEALQLAVALHETSATTFVLVNEGIRLLTARVPPAVRTVELIYTQLFVQYVKDYALSNWRIATDEELDLTARREECDDLLLGIAHTNGIPLITNEGNSPSGIDDGRGLRGRGRAQGVAVFTPGEYVRQLQLNMPPAIRAFADRFKGLQETYIPTRGQPDDAQNVRDALDFIGMTYQWCLGALK